ncbi:MAG: hypothetical protein A2Y20_04080 [Firmicutes bacterium GWF2_51_9]|nr:MAG: hypothetical protein A2Y20_04080 [Firmicutes bacterium GWF2_51_9]OGS59607.1 MAG: hypothetical protein A2Y19_01660 [Firmicutes bacterium GWE2_51_13]HBZ41629.1 hypothetical protein [Erysipelotrichaceae bacterium]
MYFHVECQLSKVIDCAEGKGVRVRYAREIDKSNMFIHQLPKDLKFMLIKLDADMISFAFIIPWRRRFEYNPKKLSDDYLQALKLDPIRCSVQEITLSEMRDCLNSAYRFDNISMNQMRIEDIFDFNDTQARRNIIDEIVASDFNQTTNGEEPMIETSESMKHVLNEIKSRRSSGKFLGHLYHFRLSSRNSDQSQAIVHSIINSMTKSGCLLSRRLLRLEVDNFTRLTLDEYVHVFDEMMGGSIWIYSRIAPDDDNLAGNNINQLDYLLEFISKYRHSVLVFLESDSTSGPMLNQLVKELSPIRFVEINDVDFSLVNAIKIAKKTLSGIGLKITSDKLKAHYPKNQISYSITEVNAAVDSVIDGHLNLPIVTPRRNSKIVIEDSSDSLSQLNQFIGLKEVKKQISEFVKYYEVKKRYGDLGFPQDEFSCVMAFHGNPGTAKTSIARIMAKVLREKGILSVGGLIEVGRSNLVGKYVGWTSVQVKEIFESAKGNVLLIDEAYSLVDEKNGLYGDEAINAIVTELGKRYQDLVVVFAGYSDPMNDFIDRNPGLRSRIQLIIEFPDYSATELTQIAMKMVKDQSLMIDRDALELLERHFRRINQNENFGNGRYVYNIIEKAKRRLASRLYDLDSSQVDEAIVKTLLVEDFEEIREGKQRIILS